MRVPYELEDVNLSVDPLDIRQIQYLLLLENLDGYLLSGEGMGCHLDLPEGAFAQGLPQEVVTYSFITLHRYLLST